MDDYIKGINSELVLFQNKTLITKEYREAISKWYLKAGSGISNLVGGPTLEMDKVITLNGKSTTATNSDGDFETAAIVCPITKEIRIVLKHESTIDLPIPDVKITLYLDKIGPDTEVASNKTNENGEVVFVDLIAGKSYYARVIDDNLAKNNDTILKAYDEQMLEMHAKLSAKWGEYEPQWRVNPISAALLLKFGEGLYNGLFSLWDDAKLAYNVITNADEYAAEIYAGAKSVLDIVGNVDEENIRGVLESGKEMARELLTLFNDEAALYLVARAVSLNLRMYPWGTLLPTLVELGGEIIGGVLAGLVFGALLSLVAGPLGIAYMAYRLGKVLKNAMKLIQEVWKVMKTILKSTIELVQSFFDKTRKINHRRQVNAPLKPSRQNTLGTSQTTELGSDIKQTHGSSESPNGRKEQNTSDTCTNGCPVSMVSGEELLSLSDAELPGVFPFTFIRQYRSSAVELPSVFGYGWSHSLQQSIRFDDDTISWTDHENLTTILPLPDEEIPAGGNMMAKAAVWLSREKNEYLFSSAGLNGWIMHVQRESDHQQGIITGFSRRQQKLSLHYRNGLPARLDNPAGASLIFHYADTDRGPRLTEVLLARLPADIDAEPLSLMRYEYDVRGQISAAINPAGEAERYEYRDDYVFSKRVLGGGAEFYWEWEGEGKASRAIRHWSNLPNLDRRYVWDTAAGEVTIVYEDGSEEVWKHDKDTARQIKQVTASGAVTEKHYGEQGELLEEVGPAGQVTRYTYNQDLLCTSETLPDGQMTRSRYSRGRLMERRHYSNDFLAKRCEYWEYDKDDNVIAYTNPAGAQWRYEWSEGGSLTAVYHPDDTSERYTVNALGQVLEYRNRLGEVTYYRYSARGQLIYESQYHPREDLAGAQVPATRLTWDAVGRLTHIYWPDGTSKEWQFNPYGQVTLETDEKGRETRYEYMPGSALVSRISYPDRTSLAYHYHNIHGQISDIVNQSGDRYHIDYTSTGLVSEERTFDGRRLCWGYDANDRLIKRIEYGDSGREDTALITEYERDISGKLIARILPDGQRIDYRYDTFGQLVEVNDGHWPLAWQYDIAGRLTEEHQGFASQYYAYEQGGHLSRMRFADGNILAFHHQGGQVCRIDHNGQVLTEHHWQEGREERRILGGDLTSRNLFDSRGRLISQQVKVRDNESHHIRRDYVYDAVGNLDKITDLRKGIRTFTHDLKDRLTGAHHKPCENKHAPDSMAWKGLYEQFTHDGTDNVLGMDLPLDELSNPAKVKANRLTIQGDRHYEYDEYGNLTREQRGKNQYREHRYQWDCQHRLISFTDIRRYDDGVSVGTTERTYRYQYDAFGRRIRKTDEDSGQSTLFFWQGDRMVTECDESQADFSPSLVKNERTKAEDYQCISYVYEPGNSFKPLAQIRGRGRGGRVYYYINDQLGTPQELVAANGEIVWSGIYRTYGNLAVAAGNVEQRLRFQGQYYDEESGLHYNRHRYYDPLAGRYLSQDPIGLAGGMNGYAYVPNPLTWIDPLGLACVQTGDKTPGGREFTEHGAEQANSRKFTSESIDNIINNNKKNRVKEINQDTGRTQWRYQDARGNTVITNEAGNKIVTVYSHPKGVNGGNFIPKLTMKQR